ncbi:GAD-like domain-containing protein [Mycobacterium sp. ST-F2]|uniref:GAD-like domain-containing protein n=1 Tax=Mycobacterium sp. ST-F2 TaxID=1490484 RepID=UPI000939ED5F
MSREPDRFIGVCGEPTAAHPVPDERYAQFAGLVPDLLIDFWRQYGFSGFGSGPLWIWPCRRFVFILW